MLKIYCLLFLTTLTSFQIEGKSLAPSSELPSLIKSPFKERCQNAKAGDYVVTHQDHAYSLLFIRKIDSQYLVLEEITVAENLIDLKKIDWKKWVKEKALGHTSWTLYKIDLAHSTLIEAFSFSKKGWLYLDDTQQLLSKMLSLPFQKLDPKDQRKIGALPPSSAEDHRPIWTPPLFIEGKKQQKARFDVWEGKWPKDGSAASGCAVQIYLNQADPSFLFPHWIEVKSPHYRLKIRSIDSGRGMESIYPEPEQSPR